MEKKYTYVVNGREFLTDEAFGEVWNEVKRVAKEENAEIWRAECINGELKWFFYTDTGIILSEKCYTPERAFRG